MVGKSLGPYEVLEQLGAGGMGEVYLGQDTRLGRRVAIKVLPADLASDPERLARFEQEARAAAALNHPHIAIVHDVGCETAEDGASVHFMVQEYLDGRSLRDRLAEGALPPDKAVGLGIEIGEALIAAHKAGIVHRDLKPDNIFVTTDGHAKVLDFGLAKLTEAATGDRDLSMSPTMLGTVAGQVLGTAGYMAPEQAAGRTDVDHRADLFAFGCVLYEMLTGRQPFAGRSVAETLSRIQHDEPEPISGNGASLSDALQPFVDKCLTKDADLRFQHADDAVVDLRRIRAAGPTAPPAASEGRPGAAPRDGRSRRGMPLALTALLVVIAAVAGGWVAQNMLASDTNNPVALSINLPDGLTIPTYVYEDAHSRATMALSPDGDMLAFVAERDGVGGLFLRDLTSYEISEVPNSEGATTPFFSPDGLQVGFMARGRIWRANVPVGVPVEVGDVTVAAMGASWGADGTIVYAPSYASELWRIPASGGVAEPFTTLRSDTREASHRWPQILPDGSGVLFTIKTSTAETFNDAHMALASIDSGEHEIVAEGGHRPRYIDGGYLVYGREGRLFASTFDPAAREVGPPVPILDGVFTSPTSGATWAEIATNGTLAWLPGGAVEPRVELTWVDLDGTRTPLTLSAGDLGLVTISPDAHRAVVQVPAANDKLWLLELDQEEPLFSRLSTVPGNDLGAAWSPDGQWVFLVSDGAGGEPLLYRLPASGGGDAELLEDSEGFVNSLSVSAPAGLLAFDRIRSSTGSDIWVVPINPDGGLAGEPEAVFSGPFAETMPAINRDGTLLAFVSDESGSPEVYVGRYPPVGGKRLVSAGGGRYPRWLPGSDTLLYWNDQALYAAQIITTPEIRVASRRVVLDPGPYLEGTFDVLPDGSRLLVASVADPSMWEKTQINVILNWTPELRRRVANGR